MGLTETFVECYGTVPVPGTSNLYLNSEMQYHCHILQCMNTQLGKEATLNKGV